MRLKFLILILINTIMISYGQKYVVEKVQLTESLEKKYVSDIPKIKDLLNDNNPVVDRINSQILDRFMINSYEQSEIDEFRWFNVEFSSDMHEDILYISFSGEYVGAYPNGVTDELFFDLKSGEALKYTIIPFQTMFTLSGYLDFLHKYWLEGVQKEFIMAIECAKFEPYCSFYDIYSYNINENKLSISLTDECYPHVAEGCSPVYSISIEIDSIKQYLNSIGKYILLESNYMNLTPIEKYLENERLKEKVPNNVFLFGKIGDKYPISMAINIEKQDEISGLYYYDTKLQKINLKGQIKDNTMFLTETVSNKQTGLFELDINVDNYPIDGKWQNLEKTKSLDVKFTKIMTCKNY
jgi:hypothetical protein